MQCTARCLQRVAQRKCWLIDNYFKEYKHLKTAEPHVACKGVSTVFVLIENAMYRTLLAQRKCWLIDNYFKEYKHLKTAEPHVASNVWYISFQRNLQLKIHLSSYPKW